MKKNIFYNTRLDRKDLDIKELSYLRNIDQKQNVDINKLLNRVKIEQVHEKKEKIIFFSLGILLLGFMGIFISIIK
tara:strand:- start:115 stop:342 length:228 start_codon:yes stop_codon:yes gene_type:complete